MKLLTLNFLTCAVKSCKSSPAAYPLHVRDAELEQQELEFDDRFLVNILPRVEWDALRGSAMELGFTTLPAEKPAFAPLAASSSPSASAEPESDAADTDLPDAPAAVPTSAPEGLHSPSEEKLLHDLHTLLLETHIMSGKLVCGNCGHEYAIKEGIANFLLPNHLGECLLVGGSAGSRDHC
ncbi:MAG: hypothetical protein M1819_002255 [Sarea resinae]|nr:MAG: hypothetical protein M1819_002255 [Sarea resinae]